MAPSMSRRGFYNRRVLPRLINAAMSRDDVAKLRASNVPRARGIVLEIGIGSGLNVPFYTGAVERLLGVDPSPELLSMAREHTAKAPFPADLLTRGAESLPLADDSVDTVVMTWSLCSMANPSAALVEMRRVLRPGGVFIFVEHGLAPDAGVQKWQNRLTPMWRRFAGGCHLNRPVAALIRDAGFAIHSLRTGYLPGPKPMTFTYEGMAHADDSTRAPD
jgi:ubiquinone/menaquinone biosynthesis C-methylase UbiE